MSVWRTSKNDFGKYYKTRSRKYKPLEKTTFKCKSKTRVLCAFFRPKSSSRSKTRKSSTSTKHPSFGRTLRTKEKMSFISKKEPRQ